MKEYYECPHCKTQLSILAINVAKYDYGCPRCLTSFTKFKRIIEK